MVDDKVNLEIEKISELTNIINNIKNTTDYEKLYSDIKNDLNNKYLSHNLIDDKSFEICIQIINNIFNFYMNGYPDIPDEYIKF